MSRIVKALDEYKDDIVGLLEGTIAEYNMHVTLLAAIEGFNEEGLFKESAEDVIVEMVEELITECKDLRSIIKGEDK